ncbi:tyrosine--tRNA ligase [Candidatus Purcelliella pentastirinorum]|uniref:tyrosine--tRNA ligase n=1 Tax=Candidatus Purcelliella pentastirinorum TaxID=472834 RepID=UPI00237B541E|nr:tyrosine--tRNA ligase [Candidatus Purcelliella pentastirinorum]WDR80039.1 tyrosine--tRNA ligase [Candidatus Purcelliella pentastirinorum]
MKNINLIKKLKKRGLIKNITNEKKLIRKIKNENIKLYCGFDPTAESLHLGHLIPIICLKHFQKYGHIPVILIGGATSIIGDPTLKKKERKKLSKKQTNKYTKKIKIQINKILKDETNNKNLNIINNYTWFKNTKILNFLIKIGKYFSINNMINKDFIKKRIKNINHGISFSEFSYNLLQSYDFYKLNKKHNVILQIGGADQWGNMISGIELIKKINKKKTFALTVPLLTKSNGEKFGKSEKQNIWLDEKKTSPYKFYQFWMNINDKEIYNLLKIFTFMKISKIKLLIKKNKKHEKKNIIQSILAKKITTMIHGEKNTKIAENITKILFHKKIKNITKKNIEQLKQGGIAHIKIKNNENINLTEILIKIKLTTSKTQARKIIISNAIMINNKKQKNTEHIIDKSEKLFNKYTIIKKGKKKHFMIIWQ